MANLWSSADAYERFMSRWSRGIAAQFVPWLEVPPGKTWLDVGCGTGALTQAILDLTNPSSVLGIEPSPTFIERARATVSGANVGFREGGAEQLPDLGKFDAVVSGLVLNFLPDPADSLREMAQITSTGGVVAAYVWDYAEGMQLVRFFWDVASELDPAAALQDEGRRSSVCQPDALISLAAPELSAVEVTALTTAHVFPTFDAYWQPFLGGVGTPPAYVASLDEDHRAALREALRARLPASADGSIALTARAWAVKGRREH
jgi:trans-aconitate methyltransferase